MKRKCEEIEQVHLKDDPSSYMYTCHTLLFCVCLLIVLQLNEILFAKARKIQQLIEVAEAEKKYVKIVDPGINFVLGEGKSLLFSVSMVIPGS